ncbi:serine/arginine repetitive matrix protein 1-like [Leucoraja erinacea]|uniref:serine/arginine repetitive matrix protein 1-like n=1 Tax=Leucoraja erinaceus TaxID=7782 RepID=UPI00245494AA|nr:serine/arginine repetitive matrix protein 1-like [Leucoraja erinacea]
MSITHWLMRSRTVSHWPMGSTAITHWLLRDKSVTQWLIRETSITHWPLRDKSVTQWLIRETSITHWLLGNKSIAHWLVGSRSVSHWLLARSVSIGRRRLAGTKMAARCPATPRQRGSLQQAGADILIRPGAAAVDGGGPPTRSKARVKQVHFRLSPPPAPGQNPSANQPRATQPPLDTRAEQAWLPLAGRPKRVHFPLDKESDGFDHPSAQLATSAGPPTPVQYQPGSKEAEAIIDYVAVKRIEGGSPSRSPKPLPSSDPARRSPAHRHSPQAAEGRRQPARGPASRSNDGPNGAVDRTRAEKTAAVSRHKVLGGGGAASSPRREGPLDPRRRDGVARRGGPRRRAQSADPITSGHKMTGGTWRPTRKGAQKTASQPTAGAAITHSRPCKQSNCGKLNCERQGQLTDTFN